MTSQTPTAPTPVGSETRSAARAVLALTAAEVAGKVATLAVMIAAARSLGRGGFGTFSVALALALLLATLVSWGFDTLVTREGSRDAATLPAAYADTVLLRLALTVATLLVELAVLGDLDDPGHRALLVLTASTLLDTFSDAGRAVAAALGRQPSVAALLVVQRAVGAVVSLAALAAGGGVVGLSAGFLVGSVAGVFAVLLVVRRMGVPLDLRTADLRRALRLLRDSASVAVNSVVSTALFRLDAVLLGALAGSVAVGRYAAAYRLLETAMFINWAVARAVFPRMAAAEQPWQVRRGVERGTTVCAFVFAPYSVLLLVRGGDILRLVYGPSYAGRGAIVLAWLAFAPLAFGVAYLSAYALYALERSRAVLLCSLLALVVNTAANLVAIPLLGDVGAAVTTTASYLLEAVVLLVVLGRAVGRPKLLRSLALPAAAAVPSVVLLLLTPLPVVPLALVEGVVYLGCWLALSRRYDPEGVAVLRSLLPGRLA